MLTLQELLEKVESYLAGQIALHEFSDWFEDNSSIAYSTPALRDAFAAIEGAFAQYYFDHIEETLFRKVLEAAIDPFVPQTSRDRAEYRAPLRSA